MEKGIELIASKLQIFLPAPRPSFLYLPLGIQSRYCGYLLLESSEIMWQHAFLSSCSLTQAYRCWQGSISSQKVLKIEASVWILCPSQHNSIYPSCTDRQSTTHHKPSQQCFVFLASVLRRSAWWENQFGLKKLVNSNFLKPPYFLSMLI